MLFDSHCHLTDGRFAPDDLRSILQHAVAANVTRLVTIGSNPADTETALERFERIPGIWFTAGFHPHVAGETNAEGLAHLREIVERERGRIVAIGEAGLDYHYDNSPRGVQRAVFEQQLQLASDRGLPVVVHSRDADDDTIAMIRGAEGAVTGVLHCFAGKAPLLDAAVEAGWMVSFSGLISFRNYDGADLVRAVPIDRLMVETDSPYLAPVPYRGKRNEPAYVREVAATAATIRGMDLDAFAEAATANTLRFYQLPADAPTLDPTALD